MKNKIIYLLFLPAALLLWGCEKTNYPGGVISPYFSIFDIQNLHNLAKGGEVTLNTTNMFGSSEIAGVVISDHTEGNMLPGILVIQDARRLGKLRGIAIPLGDAAANYAAGDSLHIKVEGKVVKRVNGQLQLTGVTTEDITKMASNVPIPLNRVTANLILAKPEIYENTLVAIVKGGFDPLPKPGDVMSGNWLVGDGFGDMPMFTEPSAAFAQKPLTVLANYFGVVNVSSGPEGQLMPQLRLRKGEDVQELSAVVEITPIIITGFMSDVKGGDGNYEYIQLMATRDIDFAVTPFSVVVTNNANASEPTGYPRNGWGTGDMRTYKFNLTSGKASKGTFFYVGGTGRRINGANSTSISSSNWIRSFNYTTTDGDGFGRKTGGLFANSGNASGLAVFEGTTVNANTKPIDVIFVATGGSLYTAGPPALGYRITNTDWYDVKNPITIEDQPFYRAGSNTMSMVYNTADLGYWLMLGGEYNPAIGRWTKARVQNNVLLTKESLLEEIEGEGSTKLKQP